MNRRIEISKRLLLINSVSGALVKFINAAVLFWLSPYLIRRIGTDGYALLPLSKMVILLVPLMTSALTAGLERYVLAAHARGDDRGVTQIVSTMFPLLVLMSVGILAGGWLFAWHLDKVLTIPSGQRGEARIMMALLTVSMAIQPAFAPFAVGIYVRQKYALYNMMNVSNQLFRAFLLVLLLSEVSARALWVVVANVTADITLLTGTCLVSRRMIPALRFDVREIRWRRARELVSFGGWNFLGSLASHLRQITTILILNKTATNTDLSMFDVGSQARRQVDSWVGVLIRPLNPVVTGMQAMGAYARVRNVYTRGGRLALWVVLLPALPAIIYSQVFIRLYIGEEYADTGVVMALTLACLPITAGGYMLWPLANATGRIRLAGATALGSQLAIIVAAFYLVHKLQWGAVGVALPAFAIPAVISVAVNWPLGQRLVGIKFGEYARRTLLPGLTPGCVAAVVWVLLDIVVRPDSWVGLGLCTLIGVVCYAAVLLGFCMEPQDVHDLRKITALIGSRVRQRVPAGNR